VSTIGTFLPDQEPWDILSVGRQIRIMREERHVTVGALAAACNVTPAYIYQMETGTIIPSLRIIGGISEVLHIHPRELFV
jgi:transcriptional regulator with XRE-family HTH domain